MKKILRRNQNGFRKGCSTIGQILTARRIIEAVKTRQIPTTLLFVDLSKAFDSVGSRMEDGKNTVALRNTQRNCHSYNDPVQEHQINGQLETEFFDILAEVLQGDTLAPFLFVICLDYVLRISVDKCNEYGLTLELARSRRFHTKKITDADYADNLALLSDNSYNAQKLLHILEQSAAFIGLNVNASKTECMCYNQDGGIETLNKTLLKKVHDFVYLSSNIASTGKDVLIRISKAWSTLD